MTRRIAPAGLRSQLTLAIALITILALALSFLAVYRGTTGRLKERIDEDLKSQAAEWSAFAAGRDLSTPQELEAAARGFIDTQGYHPASRIFVVDVAGAAPVSNQPRALGHEIEHRSRDDHDRNARGAGDGLGVVEAATGITTAKIHDIGHVRVLTVPIVTGGRRAGTLQIAESLRSVENAGDSLLRTFVLVGALALVLAVIAGLLLAGAIAAPLRRMASVASAVDGGELSLRAGTVAGGRGEAGVLAGAFDRMLERLERAFERQRDFVSDASHELRTPLAVLRAQVELLDRERDEQRRHEGTATLLRRLDELDRLVTDILTLASADGARIIEPQRIDLDGYFEDLRRDLPLFGERDFALTAVGGTLDADPDRLTQVLRNLVRNAVAHTEPDDRVAVTASAAGSRLQIAVADSGPGIAAEHLDRIFERFYRVEESRSRDSGGSGLGLAIAKAIVEAHGGRIWAQSQPGRGMTVVLELPGYSPPVFGRTG